MARAPVPALLAVRVTGLRWTEGQYRARVTQPAAGASHQAWKEREAHAWNAGPRSFSLTLPFPPSVNALYLRDRKTGTKHLTPEQLAFRRDVAGIFALSRAPQLAGVLAFRMELRPSPKQRSDADAGIKATLDALQHAGAFPNDRQIKSIHVDSLPPIEGYPAHVVVTVTEI